MSYDHALLIFVAVPILFGILVLASALLPLSELAGERVTPDSSPGARRGRSLSRSAGREISLPSGEVANPARSAASPVLSASTPQVSSGRVPPRSLQPPVPRGTQP